MGAKVAYFQVEREGAEEVRFDESDPTVNR